MFPFPFSYRYLDNALTKQGAVVKGKVNRQQDFESKWLSFCYLVVILCGLKYSQLKLHFLLLAFLSVLLPYPLYCCCFF